MSDLNPSPRDWQRIAALVESALNLTEEERRILLDVACAGEPGLRERVERLLAADAEAGAFLERPAVVSMTAPAVTPLDEDR